MRFCCNYETLNGRDIAVPFTAPEILDEIAAANSRRVLRYYTTLNDLSDEQARQLACSQIFLRDALFLTIKILGIIAETGKSLARLSNELPLFCVARKQ